MASKSAARKPRQSRRVPAQKARKQTPRRVTKRKRTAQTVRRRRRALGKQRASAQVTERVVRPTPVARETPKYVIRYVDVPRPLVPTQPPQNTVRPEWNQLKDARIDETAIVTDDRPKRLHNYSRVRKGKLRDARPSQEILDFIEEEINEEPDVDNVDEVVGRTDGENDSDQRVNKLSLDDVLDFLYKIPDRVRKILLTSMFGATLGAVFDILMGSPIGITSFILRSILKLVPGGWLILGAFDALGFLLARTKDVFRITHDPGFVSVATQVQNAIPPEAAATIAREAERQLGASSLGATVAALLHAIYLRVR